MFALFTSAAIAFFVDQASKRSVQAHLTGAVSWGGILQIRRVRHSKQLYKKTVLRIGLVVIWVAALVSAAWLHKSGQWLQTRFAMASIGCALGGAAGNLVEERREERASAQVRGRIPNRHQGLLAARARLAAGSDGMERKGDLRVLRHQELL